jgi:hypothetical protein
MPITHDESTRTIIVTGDNNGNPYTYEDIYQYTASQGLDWITKISSDPRIYKQTCRIHFNGARFSDHSFILIHDARYLIGTGWWNREIFLIENNSDVQFGNDDITSDVPVNTYGFT